MARNVEIKARLTDLEKHVKLAEEVSDGSGTTIEQADVFFHCAAGRLKLRIRPGGEGELIHYQRPDRAGPKPSDYVIARVGNPGSLREALERALGVRAVVRKTRRLYMSGRTRIHLDSVEGLGDFLELEVVLEEGEDVTAGEREAARLMTLLGIDPGALVDGAYVDLLESSEAR